MGQVKFHKDSQDYYWRQENTIGQQLTGASPVTIPEVSALVNMAQFPS